MADEAFALSPISARAAQPSEEDYDAISQAFMETSRGRWFLTEYARRNRNADTSMVLDAVSRIEKNLAVQRQPDADDGISEALAIIRRAVDEARANAIAVTESYEPERHLAPVQKGVRVIREIAWRLREIGADGRIWDLVESQLTIIEAFCGNIASVDPKAAMNAALDLVATRIDELDDRETKPVPAVSETPGGIAPEQVQQEEITSEISAGADDGYDDAMLDMVALEMAAPDESGIDDEFEPASAQPFDAKPSPSDHLVTAPQTELAVSEPIEPEPIKAALVRSELFGPDAIAITPAFQNPMPQKIPEITEPAPSLSLGSTLIANGLVAKSRAALTDPLAPIRRMSQAEKIAFFS